MDLAIYNDQVCFCYTSKSYDYMHCMLSPFHIEQTFLLNQNNYEDKEQTNITVKIEYRCHTIRHFFTIFFSFK